jgi:hypothetical protein
MKRIISDAMSIPLCATMKNRAKRLALAPKSDTQIVADVCVAFGVPPSIENMCNAFIELLKRVDPAAASQAGLKSNPIASMRAAFTRADAKRTARKAKR